MAIVYKTCNAAAFIVGDRVVIQFTGQNWSAPRVIGFESHPRDCAFYLAQFKQLQPYNPCPYNPSLGKFGVHVDPNITMQFIETGNDEVNPISRCIPVLGSSVPPADWYIQIDYTFDPDYWSDKYPGGYGDVYIGASFAIANDDHPALEETYRLKLEVTLSGVSTYTVLQVNGEEIQLGNGTHTVTRDILVDVEINYIGFLLLVRGIGPVSIKVFSILPAE